ncbi:kinase-like protein [Athelia psychrophila]|uniref:Kinase-like protein n=1 Tax=Athelia psychrophila TaxID=1759441 RepID=A0A166LIL3_9AGAM|nr:kinase-like protein [Fibularhizoctonia sp. CBS 109695]
MDVVQELGEDALSKDLTGEIKHEKRHFASGAYSDVYGGDWTDASTGRVTRVAIKVLRGITDNETGLMKTRKMIRREIAVWMGLEHPNITPFLGVVTGFGPLSAMVSPYCSKETIVRYTLENPVVDRLPLILGVANGLAYLHSLNIIHGDLKGDNILIDDDYSPRLVDFGRSRILGRRGFTDAPTVPKRYMAPELMVIPDDITTADRKIEIYAFAMVVIEVCILADFVDNSGRINFVVLQILTSKPTFLVFLHQHYAAMLIQGGKRSGNARCLPTHFADEIWEITKDCWHDDPQARPEMAAVILRLEEMRLKKSRAA